MRSPPIERHLRLTLEQLRAIVFVTTGAFCQTFLEDATACGRVLRVAVRDCAAAAESARISACGVSRATSASLAMPRGSRAEAARSLTCQTDESTLLACRRRSSRSEAFPSIFTDA